MTLTFGRVMSAATAGYAVFALVKPRHLGAALRTDPAEQESYDLLATTYGWRDLAVSSVGLLGRSPAAVRASLAVRVLLDLTDAATLAPRAETDDARTKVLAATLGWATLNSAALAATRGD